jgi:hypothetical protein
MNCEEVVEILKADPVPDTLRACAAREHTRRCAECRAALAALRALAAERELAMPPLAGGAFDRALQRAVYSRHTEPSSGRGFWLGAALGGALAASFAVAATLLWLQTVAPTAPATPQVRLALNELRDVNVSLEAPEDLAGAEIHVVLTGSIGLDGFGAQRELRWVANLERGVNQLTLPLVAVGPDGGQVIVEVVHSTKRRTFVVDVQTVDAPPAASLPKNRPGPEAV